MKLEKRTMVPAQGDFSTRAEGDDLYIEGYFAVFNSTYEICPGIVEIIAPGAFADTLGEDIRALTNHDTTLVLGRNKAGADPQGGHPRPLGQHPHQLVGQRRRKHT